MENFAHAQHDYFENRDFNFLNDSPDMQESLDIPEFYDDNEFWEDLGIDENDWSNMLDKLANEMILKELSL